MLKTAMPPMVVGGAFILVVKVLEKPGTHWVVGTGGSAGATVPPGRLSAVRNVISTWYESAGAVLPSLTQVSSTVMSRPFPENFGYSALVTRMRGPSPAADLSSSGPREVQIFWQSMALGAITTWRGCWRAIRSARLMLLSSIRAAK